MARSAACEPPARARKSAPGRAQESLAQQEALTRGRLQQSTQLDEVRQAAPPPVVAARRFRVCPPQAEAQIAELQRQNAQLSEALRAKERRPTSHSDRSSACAPPRAPRVQEAETQRLRDAAGVSAADVPAAQPQAADLAATDATIEAAHP